MKSAQCSCEGDHGTRTRRLPKTNDIGQEVYPDHLPIATSAAKCLVNGSCNKLGLVKTRPCKVIEASLTTVTVDKKGIRNKVSMDQPTVAQTARETPSGDDVTQRKNTTAVRNQLHATGSNSGG